MNKVVLRMEEISDSKIKKKAMKVVSSIPGVESVSVETKEHKLTLTGDMDPVVVVGKLRKLCHTEILSVGPAKEEKKKNEEPKKDEKKAEEEKKKKKNENLEGIVRVCEAIEAYNHHHQMMREPHYYYTSVEENPNACVIS